MTDQIIQQCLNVLKQDNIKQEINQILNPVITTIFKLINPYLYIIISSLLFIFILLLTILILLLLILKHNYKILTD